MPVPSLGAQESHRIPHCITAYQKREKEDFYLHNYPFLRTPGVGEGRGGLGQNKNLALVQYNYDVGTYSAIANFFVLRQEISLH